MDIDTTRRMLEIAGLSELSQNISLNESESSQTLQYLEDEFDDIFSSGQGYDLHPTVRKMMKDQALSIPTKLKQAMYKYAMGRYKSALQNDEDLSDEFLDAINQYYKPAV